MRLRHLANSQVLSSIPIPSESCVVWSLSETHDMMLTDSQKKHGMLDTNGHE
jgi:hypothetical protein